MMTSAALVRLALLQLVVIAGTIVACGLTLRFRFGPGTHLPLLATYVRDYGFIMLLIPVVWAIWGLFELHKSLTNTGDGVSVFASGIWLLVLLVALGFFSWMSACTHHTLLIQLPPPSAAHGPP